MESKDKDTHPEKIEKLGIPPRRGQIKAKIFEEIVETVKSVALGGFGSKSKEISSKSHSSDGKKP